MNAFFYPSKRGINFAKIRGFKVTDYIGRRCPIGDKAAVWPGLRCWVLDMTVAWLGAAFEQITARANPCSRHLWGTLARAVASI